MSPRSPSTPVEALRIYTQVGGSLDTCMPAQQPEPEQVLSVAQKIASYNESRIEEFNNLISLQLPEVDVENVTHFFRALGLPITPSYFVPDIHGRDFAAAYQKLTGQELSLPSNTSSVLLRGGIEAAYTGCPAFR